MRRDGDGREKAIFLFRVWGQDRSRPLKFRGWDPLHDLILTACIGVVMGEGEKGGFKESLEVSKWENATCSLLIRYEICESDVDYFITIYIPFSWKFLTSF